MKNEDTLLTKGSLNLQNPVAVLLTIYLHRFTGNLTLTRSNVKKRFFFSNGNMVFAASNQLEDRLGDILLTEGKITQAQYDESVTELKKGKKRQGTILVKLGYISTHDLILAIRHQIKLILLSVITWKKGHYNFYYENTPFKENVTLRENTLKLIDSTMSSMENASWLHEGIEELTSLLRIHEEKLENISKISLTPYEMKIYKFIGEGEKTVEEICEWSEYNEIETLKSISYLLESKLLRINNPYWENLMV